MLFRVCQEVGYCGGDNDPFQTEESFVQIVCRPAIPPEKAADEYEAEEQVSSILDQMRESLRTGCERTPPETTFVASEQPQLIQEVMMSFIRTLVRGVCIEVLLDNGSVLLPEASLNYELTHLILDVSEDQMRQRTTEGVHVPGRRSIPLADIENVATPSDLSKMNIQTSTQLYLDDRCCTLIIKDYEFVTLRFDTERLCDYFASCLRILISAPPSPEDSFRAAVNITR
mmetsp:Transcript_49464/g.78268  ORF Transcript_49464/g.78268 Transcript_49464/m.78268 type:complete len:229 (-) Transcript_49464:50-736(-)